MKLATTALLLTAMVSMQVSAETVHLDGTAEVFRNDFGLELSHTHIEWLLTPIRIQTLAAPRVEAADGAQSQVPTVGQSPAAANAGETAAAVAARSVAVPTFEAPVRAPASGHATVVIESADGDVVLIDTTALRAR